MPYKILAFFLSESMKIWKSDILTPYSKSGYVLLSGIDKVGPFLMYVLKYYIILISKSSKSHWFFRRTRSASVLKCCNIIEIGDVAKEEGSRKHFPLVALFAP